MPFNARASHHDVRYFFGHTSPAAGARELFTPSTDSECLLNSVEKMLFSVSFKVLCGRGQKGGGVFEFLANFVWTFGHNFATRNP